MLIRLLRVMVCLLVVLVPHAEQIRSVSDYTFSDIQNISSNQPDSSGSKVDVTQRIYNALTSGDPAAQVASQDLSRTYLYQIFGAVPGSLEGKSGFISILFRILNIGIISIASSLVIYSTVFGLSATSQDGGAMGSGRFSGWAIARVIGSIAVLVPTKGGYSYAQIIVMKIVIAGVVAANTVWEATIDYLNEFGSDNTFSAAPLSASDSDRAALLLGAKNLTWSSDGSEGGLPSLGYPKQNYSQYKFSDSSAVEGNFIIPINQAVLDTVNIFKACKLVMPSVIGADLTNMSVGVLNQAGGLMTTISFIRKGASVTVRGFEIVGLDKDWSRHLAIYIQQTAQRLLRLQEKGSATEEEVADIFAQQLRVLYKSIEAVSSLGDSASITSADKKEDVLQLKRGGWMQAGLKYSSLTSFGTPVDTNADYFKLFPKNAGLKNYEYVVPYSSEKPKDVLKTRALPTTSSIIKLNFEDKEFKGVLSKDSYRLLSAYTVVQTPGLVKEAYGKRFLKKIEKAISADLDKYIKDIHKAFVVKLNKADGQFMGGLSTSNLHLWSGGVVIDPDIVPKKINTMSIAVVEGLFALLNGDGESNPIIATMKTGDTIITAAKVYFNESTTSLYDAVNAASWNAFAISKSISAVIGAFKAITTQGKVKAKAAMKRGDMAGRDKANKENFKYQAMKGVTSIVSDPVLAILEFSQAATKAIVGLFLPLGAGLGVSYLVAGVVLAAYVPFVPTFIYLFSILAWFFAVVEAMIAAPIIFIGLANPEGHDAMGKSEQGIMLLLGVFLRPMLTLIGFLLALVLSYALITLFNGLFRLSTLFYIRSIFTVMPEAGYEIILSFMAASLLLLYVYSLVVVLEQCYSMIYVVPDQILKWIGGPMDSAGSSVGSALRNISGGLTQHSKVAAEGGSKTTSGATQIQTRN